MEFQELNRMINNQEKGFALSEAFPALMRKVYLWMTMALVISGVVAYGVAASPNLVNLIFSSRITFFGLIIVEFGLVMWLSARINKMSLTTATTMFIIYSALNGATLSVIFLAFSMATIAKVFFISAGTFAVAAVYGYFTKANLTKMGSLLLMALFGIIIAMVVNMFIGSSTFDYIVSCIAVILFVGLTAWDSQRIKNMLMQAPDMSENSQKMAVSGALGLYLDFINIFLYLLRIFGKNN
jgi:FtsH-binding integral membrane protein